MKADRRVKCATLVLASLVLLFGCMRPTRADNFETFNLTWSGAFFGNTAVATGQITLDTTLLPNPTFSDAGFAFLQPLVQNFSMTVSGASAGNGTFSQGDFAALLFGTDGATLDISKELVGQPLPDGGFWGGSFGPFVPGGGADFSLLTNFSDPATPAQRGPFELVTNNGSGDAINLTSFAPVPEPSSLVLLGIGIAGVTGYSWRRYRNR